MYSLVSRKQGLSSHGPANKTIAPLVPVRAAGKWPRHHGISLGDNKIRARARLLSQGGKKKKDHQAT